MSDDSNKGKGGSQDAQASYVNTFSPPPPPPNYMVPFINPNFIGFVLTNLLPRIIAKEVYLRDEEFSALDNFYEANMIREDSDAERNVTALVNFTRAVATAIYPGIVFTIDTDDTSRCFAKYNSDDDGSAVLNIDCPSVNYHLKLKYEIKAYPLYTSDEEKGRGGPMIYLPVLRISIPIRSTTKTRKKAEESAEEEVGGEDEE